MNLAHILEELAYEGDTLPREAIESAILQREEITPFLLQILQDTIDRIDELIENESYQGHLYAMYLLAQFRERRAYPLLIKLLSFPGNIPHAVIGDILTEDMSRILASVCETEIEPLKKLIENPQLNEYVRAASQTTFVALVGIKKIPRACAIGYFQSLFQSKLEKSPLFVWDNLVACACDLYPEELYEEITRAFSAKLIDQNFITLEDVGTILSHQKEEHLDHLYKNTELIEDTVIEMEKWHSQRV